MARNPATPARTTRNTRNSKVAVPTILSARLSALLREARWLVFAVLAAWLALVLASYNPLDPGWSHATHVEHVHNHGGRLGAWMSDMLLYLFGMSAWWWVVLLLQRVMAGYQRLADLIRHPEGPEVLPRVHWEQAVGFVALLLGSVGLEALRLTSWGDELPAGSGGVIGMALADFTSDALGYTGGTMVLVLLVLVGLSLFFRFSWLAVAEWVGWQLEKVWLAGKSVFDGLSERRQRQRELEASLLAQAQAQRDSEPALADTGSAKGEAAVPLAAKPAVPGREPVRTERAAPSTQRLEPALRTDFNAADAESEAGFDDDEAFENLPASQAFGAAVAGAAATATAVNAAKTANAARAANAATTDSPPLAAPAPQPVAPAAATTLKPRPPLVAPQGNDALPSLDLLDPPPSNTEVTSAETLEFQSRLIEKKLADFGVEVTVELAQPGPVITRFEIAPATGVKGSQVVNLSKDLARALSLVSIRVVETIPGKNLMGLELPNPRRQTVRLTEVLGSRTYHDSKSLLTLALGVDIAGHPVVADLARMPHLLVAGTTGSGKSVGINAMILSLLYKADAHQVRLILIDPKMLEMSVYEGIPHLLAPVVTDMRQAANALNWCVAEMERRYKLMSKMGVRNLAGYNAKIAEAAARDEVIPNPFSLTPDAPEPLTHLPFLVVVIDELADLMMVVGKKIEELIARLAQKARAAGIHLILATQRPSVDVITGLIKANIPTRIAFQVSSKIDSRTILDQMGAEALLGQGDMLYLPPGTGLPQRVHGAFVSDDEVHRVVEQLKSQGEANYIDGILEGGEGETGDGVGSVTGFADAESDPLYDQAVAVVLEHRRASISLVQRHLRIGYNRSARLLEQMERSGLVSSMQGNGNREILVPANSSKDD